jgi:hypothetical protein
MRTTALLSAGLFGLAFVLSFLLPREARPEEFG